MFSESTSFFGGPNKIHQTSEDNSRIKIDEMITFFGPIYALMLLDVFGGCAYFNKHATKQMCIFQYNYTMLYFFTETTISL